MVKEFWSNEESGEDKHKGLESYAPINKFEFRCSLV